MAQGKRNRLSAEQRADMWRRWKAGESLHEIGRSRRDASARIEWNRGPCRRQAYGFFGMLSSTSLKSRVKGSLEIRSSERP
jgi:hypothetical protein